MDNIDRDSISSEEIQKFACDILEKYRKFETMNPNCPKEDFFKFMDGQNNPSNTNAR